MSTYRVMVRCPECEETNAVAMRIDHDPGYWRDANGDGLPPSTEVEQDGACENCGHEEYTVAQELEMENEALDTPQPSKEDFVPEFDDD